jgi:hypothetical protein
MIFDLHHPPGPGAVHLGPLTGAAELAVSGNGPVDAIAVLNACLLDLPGMSVGPGGAASLSTSDRDRLTAQLYRRLYGNEVSGMSTCNACAKKFDFDFTLDALLDTVAPEPAVLDDAGWYLEGRTRFRLPTGADELAVVGLRAARAAEVIALRCAPDADPKDRARIEDRMARIAPLVDLTLAALCPECGHDNPMTFAVERYFLSRLMGERPRLMRQIHLIAATYHWSLAEITGLTRDLREQLVDQIGHERQASQRRTVTA